MEETSFYACYERDEPTHICGDGLDHRDEPQEGLRDVDGDLIMKVDPRGLEHSVGAETADNLGAASVLLTS